MLHHYSDIRSRIPEAPKWWDERGVPRYVDFGPNEGADIYAEAIALVLIACQNCGHTFKVAMSWGLLDLPQLGMHRAPKTVEEVRGVHYGDPPNIECCPAGPTMNCEDLRVLEWWNRGGRDEPRRVPEFEILLPDHPEYVEAGP